MTDIDLDRLGDIWRRQPDPAELAELKRTAERVRRRARWTQIVDIAGAVILSAIILVLVSRSPGLDTALFGGAAILYMLYGQVRHRRLRAAELKRLSGTAEEMLDQSIERVQAKVRYLRFGALALGPGVLLGALVGYGLERRSGGEWAAPISGLPGLSILVYALSAIALVALVVHMIRSYQGARRELRRLASLREAYRGADDQVEAE